MKDKSQKAYEIYTVTCKVNGKMYVGQTSAGIQKRWKEHCNAMARGSSLKFSNGLRKHGPESFDVAHYATCANQEELNALEIATIAKFDTKRSGYNSTDGGFGASGFKHSAESCQKRSAAMKGRVFSSDTLAKMSAATRLRMESVETRAALAAANTGRKPSAETRAKQSQAQRRIWTAELRALRAVAQTGRKHTAATRAKMSAALVSRVASPETRARISAAGLKRNEPRREAKRATLAARKAVVDAARQPVARLRVAAAKHGIELPETGTEQQGVALAPLSKVTDEALRQALAYDPETGIFTWKQGRNDRKGSVAGCVDASNGYVRLQIKGKMYSGHLLAYFYVHGVWPTKQVKHLNGNRSDNRIANLFAPEGANGVVKAGKKWLAYVRLNGETIRLGDFDTVEAASAARQAGVLLLAGRDRQPLAA